MNLRVLFPRQRQLTLLLLAAALVCFPLPGSAFTLNGYKWPNATQIMLHLNLVRTQVPLQDGNPTWNASAADAIALWNPFIPKVLLVAADPTPPAAQDGLNSVVFANNIYGEAFDSRTLAVTLYWRTGSVFTETDVIFNNLRSWDSYRGPIQSYGTSATYDLHRVALHEFGHVLGLGHPDERGQTVEAIMNSIISDLDHLADDDIAGGRALYGFKITSPLYDLSGTSGQLFNYQITADNSPTSFSASGLPPELQLDPATGRISGRCYTTGSFTVDVVANGAAGTTTGRFQLPIRPQGLNSSTYPPAILIGGNFSYQITASNSPTSYSASGLPAGLTFNPNTGLISGTPTAFGTFSVTVTATGPTAIASSIVSIRVNGPSITSPTGSIQLDILQSYSYQVICTHPASSFTATDLPPNFQIDPVTGVISGTASGVGYYNILVKAQTAYGEAQGIIVIQVLTPHLNGPTSLTAQVGSPFNYQVTASNNPTSFTSSPLPPGLRLYPASGRLSGVPELRGFYSTNIIARGAVGDANGYISLQVAPAPLYFTPLLGSIPSPGAGSFFLPDRTRSRLYLASGTELRVVDAESLALLGTYRFPTSIGGLAMPPDESVLYLTLPGLNLIAPIDPATFLGPPQLRTGALAPSAIEVGGDGYLYVIDQSNRGLVHQLDRTTGAEIRQFAPNPRSTLSAVVMRMSPDHNTLYAGEVAQPGPVLAKYALAPGSAPALVQRIDPVAPAPAFANNYNLSPDGSLLLFSIGSFSLLPSAIDVRSTADLNTVVARWPTSGFTNEAAFSPDGAFAVLSYTSSTRVEVREVAHGTVTKSITLPENDPAAAAGPARTLSAGPSAFQILAGPAYSAVRSLYRYSLLAPPAPPRSLLSVSTRLRAQPDANVPIGGFIIQGTAPKKVIVRAIGPSLSTYGVAGVLADPLLELHASNGSLVTSNDNWNAHRQDVLDAELPLANEREAAIVATLDPGAYTAILRGVNNTSGVALVQIYDLEPVSASRISSLSTRGRVEAGDNVMIGGFAVGGDQVTNILVRAIGPSLAQYNVPDLLLDPTLDLFDAYGTRLATNDDWTSDQQQISATGHAPGDPREAAIVRALLPGGYTAIVRGKETATGVALVEIYNLGSAP